MAKCLRCGKNEANTCAECVAFLIQPKSQAQNRPVPQVGSKDLLKGQLINHAAALLVKRISDFAEDYPRKFPKWVLREIEEHNERLRLMAIDLRKIADAL